MNNENSYLHLPHVAMIAAASLFLLVADSAIAKNGGGNNRHEMKMNSEKHDSNKTHDHDKHSGKKKDHEKYSDKSGKNCGIVPMKGCGSSSKDPVGNTRPTTTGSNPSGGGAGTPPPARPAAEVRDHRPGGNAADPVPGTIVRDHRNGADGKPMEVVSSKGGVTVYRPVKPAPANPVYPVPFVH